MVMVNKVSRRSRFTAPRRRRHAAPAAAEVEVMECITEPAMVTSNWSKLWHGREGQEAIARLLWLPSYSELFELEYKINELACGGQVM